MWLIVSALATSCSSPQKERKPTRRMGEKDQNPSPWHPRLRFNCRQVSAGDSGSQPGPNPAKSMCFGGNLHTPMHTHRDATASDLLRVVAWHQDYGCCGTSVPCGWQRGGGFRWGRYRRLTRPRACARGAQPCSPISGRGWREDEEFRQGLT